MQVQVNTDDNVQGREDVAERVEAEVRQALRRFEEQITRVEVHLNDTNADKHGPADKRCMLEARPAGRPPVAVTNEAESVALALSGATRKLVSRLETVLGRAHAAKGAASIRDAEV